MPNVQQNTGRFVLVCDDCFNQLTDDNHGRLYWAEPSCADEEPQSFPALRLCPCCHDLRASGGRFVDNAAA